MWKPWVGHVNPSALHFDRFFKNYRQLSRVKRRGLRSVKELISGRLVVRAKSVAHRKHQGIFRKREFMVNAAFFISKPSAKSLLEVEREIEREERCWWVAFTGSNDRGFSENFRPHYHRSDKGRGAVTPSEVQCPSSGRVNEQIAQFRKLNLRIFPTRIFCAGIYWKKIFFQLRCVISNLVNILLETVYWFRNVFQYIYI